MEVCVEKKEKGVEESSTINGEEVKQIVLLRVRAGKFAIMRYFCPRGSVSLESPVHQCVFFINLEAD